MNWLIFVIIATVASAGRIFTDNYVSDVYFKKSSAVAQKFFYGFIDSISAIIILIAIGFNFLQTDYYSIGIILLSGALTSIASITYFKALEIEDSTNVGIFMQITPIFYLIFGWLFFGEFFSPLQFLAFIIILIAPALIIFAAKKRSRKVKIRAIIYILISVTIGVIGNLVFVKASTEAFDFMDKIAFFLLGKGIANIIIVVVRPKWYKRWKTIFKASKHKVIRPMFVSSLISLAKEFSYHGALVTAPVVALASAAIDSAVPIVIFFMGIVLTLIWPKFGREKLDRKTVIVHLIATILVVTGIIILQF